ncbi:hypothetical protein BHE90_006095 [Fusarium euwallaceae]|uniref:Cell wall mannoprotein PIR1-like C-terminal domain-containing protein n=1 Tax=Fusarium euwallaceae TaxID=1147111 RepID=A0A430LUG8_9HYPO|nr:hypothetical protein BHE90_006095 [Fusarium euwallaceae]
MRSSLAFLALVASTFAAPQAVTEDIRPESGPPKGCSESYDGTFEVTIYKSGKSKRDVQPRECNGEGVLVMTLKDGVLKDAQGRTGYISDSYQFQFDEPPQSGSIFTAGFSVCSNGTLALGPSAVFWQCLSGDFYNLYDRHWAEQCSPVEFGIMPCGEGSKDAPKKRVVGSSIVATTVVTVVSDGTTKEVPTTIAVPMCQIGDGQVQVRTTPCDDMNLPIITAPPVSQVSDGKLQIPTDAPPAPPAPAAPAAPAGAEPAEPENNAKGGEPSGDDVAGDSPAPAGDEPAGDEPAGDEPAGGASSDEPAGEPADDGASGEEPGEPAAPAARPAGVSPGDDDAGAGPTATGGEAPANTGDSAGYKPAGGAAAGSKPAGKSAATGADDSEVLVTDSAPAPSGTDDSEDAEDTEEASATGKATRAVKPFRPQSTDSDDAEETDSSSDAASGDEDASDQAASPDSSSAAKAVPAGIALMMCVIGSLMML